MTQSLQTHAFLRKAVVLPPSLSIHSLCAASAAPPPQTPISCHARRAQRLALTPAPAPALAVAVHRCLRHGCRLRNHRSVRYRSTLLTARIKGISWRRCRSPHDTASPSRMDRPCAFSARSSTSKSGTVSLPSSASRADLTNSTCSSNTKPTSMSGSAPAIMSVSVSRDQCHEAMRLTTPSERRHSRTLSDRSTDKASASSSDWFRSNLRSGACSYPSLLFDCPLFLQPPSQQQQQQPMTYGCHWTFGCAVGGRRGERAPARDAWAAVTVGSRTMAATLSGDLYAFEVVRGTATAVRGTVK